MIAKRAETYKVPFWLFIHFENDCGLLDILSPPASESLKTLV